MAPLQGIHRVHDDVNLNNKTRASVVSTHRIHSLDGGVVRHGDISNHVKNLGLGADADEELAFANGSVQP